MARLRIKRSANMINRLLIIFSAWGFLSACVKDKPYPVAHELPNATHRGMLLCNEGSYGNNNGELAFLDLETHTLYNDLFRTANAKSLGDIVQSVSLVNGLYYVVVNHSNKIVIVDPVTFKERGSILVQSPRFITQVAADKAYISCLYFPRIYVLDLNTNSITRTIATDYPNTEQMRCRNGACYVTNWDTASKLLYKVDISTDSIIKRITLPGKASHGLAVDKENKWWILSGNKYKNTPSFLSRFDPEHDTVLNALAFPPAHDPFRLTMHPSGDTIYYINVDYNGSSTSNGLYKLGIHETSLPSAPFIAAQTNSYFYALAIDSISAHIFLSDPKGFTQQSTLYEYGAGGSLIRQYQSGIGTNQLIAK